MIDLVGQKFGRLEVVERAHNDELGHVSRMSRIFLDVGSNTGQTIELLS